MILVYIRGYVEKIQITRLGRERTLNVRVTTERSGGQAHGYVITLDDITDLVTAQRSSAWADVARRIAHEIKNPLTPIQLAAERLKRRFGKTITEGGDVYYEVSMSDAWVWDMYRPARVVKSAKVLTFRDVSIEEIAHSDREVPKPT